jgi:hypothetical protein
MTRARMTTSFQRKLRYMDPSRAETKTHHDQETACEGRDQIRSGKKRGFPVLRATTGR